MQKSQEELLKEIKLKPSNEVKTGRFEAIPLAADCIGKCTSGTCRTIV